MRNFNLDDDLKRHVKPGLIISAFTVFLIYLLMNLWNDQYVVRDAGIFVLWDYYCIYSQSAYEAD